MLTFVAILFRRVAHLSARSAPIFKLLLVKLRRARRFAREHGLSQLFLQVIKVWIWLPKLLNEASVLKFSSAQASLRRADFLARPFGVNVAGFLTAEIGLAESSRLRVEVLQIEGIPVALNNYVALDVSNREDPGGPLTTENPYRFNLIWLNSGETSNFAGRVGPHYFEGRYNIGYWVWEMQNSPADWIQRFRYFDEIWVSTRFVQDQVAARSPVPVFRVPHSIAPRRLDHHGSGALRLRANLPKDSFVFLFVFDFYSVQRKNPDALVQAFKMALADRKDAYLVLKTRKAVGQPGFGAIEQAMRGSNIRVIDEILSRAEVDSLFADCDCYISMHRSEGFGLTMFEAMTYGKPVIATAYGGNTDFMDGSNSYPLPYKLVKAGPNSLHLDEDWLWAEPDIEKAAERMRFVYENRAQAAQVGLRARQDLETNFSPERIGALVRARLESITDYWQSV